MQFPRGDVPYTKRSSHAEESRQNLVLDCVQFISSGFAVFSLARDPSPEQRAPGVVARIGHLREVARRARHDRLLRHRGHRDGNREYEERRTVS